MRDITRR